MPPENPLRILIVDDDLAFGRLLTSVLADAGYGPPRSVGTGAEAMAAAADADVILLDHQLPDANGLDLLPAIRAITARPSVILVTAHGDEALAVRALREGADDYLIKDGSLTGLLPQVVERVRRHRALEEALAAAERDLVHAERLAAIGQINVTLHHTINNPLMSAFAEAELLMGSRLDQDQRASVESIREALGRIRDILQRLGTLRHAQTTDYLEGVSMIDLSRRTRPMPVQLGEALVLFPDDDIARVVGMLLTHSGFQVSRVTTAEELSGRAGEVGVRVVVVPGSATAQAEALGGFRPSSPRDYTVVALVPGDGERARAAGADHVVTLPFDPGTFASDLLGAMRG